MLRPYRVLDLACERGLLCGQMLADLGADVIAIEPPSGSAVRRRGPFAGDVADPEHSLPWWAFARNKRSVVLDLDAADGRATLRRLAADADFLVESAPPGAMAARGLGYADLAAVNPALIYVSISPFGQDGPKAAWAATDLTVLAAGGPLILTGDADRAPVRLPVPQAFLHAGAEAAVAALIAHHERERSGRGQHVDVSAQQAVALATQSYILASALNAPEVHRLAGGLKHGPLVMRLLFRARDGWVAITFLFGSAIGLFTRRLMHWIHDEGGCDAATRDKDWIGYTELLRSGAEPIAEFERVKALVEAFTMQRTKAELLAAALERSLLIAPVATIDEVVASPQLAARDFWRTMPAPAGHDAVVVPGPFARLSATPIAYRRRAPRLGEHTAEVLAELPRPACPSRGDDARDALPLAGVKVLDFFWVMAGPSATRVLADYGATVVRVESTRRIDTARTLAPYRDGDLGTERSGCFQNLNTGKLMLTLDLTSEGGRAVALDLVRWADVVCESFSPRAMRAWGLDWERVRAIKPNVIMVSSCLMGQTGPLARYAGYGNLAAAISGFSNLGGWPDRPPAGPFSAYTDYVSPRFTAAAILGALDHRRRTGEGQYIDLSQAEASLHFLGPALLDWTVNHRVQGRVGNRDRDLAPHGVYPTAGDDQWIAIAACGDAEWRALGEILDRPALVTDARFVGPDARRANADALDAVIADATRSHDAATLTLRLQAAGVAAHAVQNSAACLADPQLRHRGHFVEIAHPDGGTVTVEGSRFHLSRTPAQVVGPAPTFGRDNQRVLAEVLGYSDEQITALVTAGALE